MTQDINNTRNSCVHCNRNAPSLAAVPPMPINLPTTPFEHIFADFFDHGGCHFLVIGDKFSGWVDVFWTSSGLNIAGAAASIRLVRTYFATFGVPGKVSTEGGLKLQLLPRSNFLQLGVSNVMCHRLIFLNLMVVPKWL